MKPVKLLFGDTYVQKHFECAQSLLGEMHAHGIETVVTRERQLPSGVDCDALVFFNRPAVDPPQEYADKPRIMIDHGASNLKWFLANARRFDFFDLIITAGPGHVDSLLAFFNDPDERTSKAIPGGFIKAKELLAPARFTREEIALQCDLDPDEPIVLFAPTWHLSRHPDMVVAAQQIAELSNHVVTLHPETVHLGVDELNVVENAQGITTELLKHADCVVSDTSSTIFEAAALGKPVVQIGLREYSDNNATMYDYPYVAGTAQLFLGGLFARPRDTAAQVAKALSGDAHARDLQRSLSGRVLQDTLIDGSVAKRMVGALLDVRSVPMARSTPCAAQEEVRAKNLKNVHDNIFFARNRLIAHGGGDYSSHHASNSLEAVSAALGAIDVVELDFVEGADGVHVAHDTFEERFGFSKPFEQLTVEEFAGGRYGGELTPLSVEQALALGTAPGKAIVCDVKAPGDSFKRVARHLYEVAAGSDALARVVMQCYSVEDFRFAKELGFQRTLLAVWKHFYLNPPGRDAFDFVSDCLNIADELVVGISAPYTNKHLDRPIYEYPEFDRWTAFWKRLYIHGAPTGQYSAILQRNFGLFADRFSSVFEFRDLPWGFHWLDYLFLNPGLIDAGVDNQVAAVNHFLQYGRAEGRPWKMEVPSDFVYATYLDLNPNLRAGGVGAAHSARAHWTRYGRAEGRRYKPS
jgi:hypothetical protein